MINFLSAFAAATLGAVLVLTPPSSAYAQDSADGDPLWEVRLGGFGRYGEAYPGSTELQVNALPLPFPIYRGKFLRLGDRTEKPVRTRLLRWDRVKLDIDFGLNFPVESDDIEARQGMPDLDLLSEVGPELEFQFREPIFGGETRLALQTRGAVSWGGLNPDWRGLIVSTELKHKRPLFSSRTELYTRLTPEFASSEYMDFFYGVGSEFATASRPAYRARSGYLGTRLSFTVKHQFSKEFEIRTGLRFGLYQGARNSDSPLLTRDTTNSFFLAFLWKFWESEARAEESF